MADFTATLIAAASADKNAENALKEYERSNFPEFVNRLAAELATEGKDLRSRQLAGIYLKNVLHAKQEHLQQQKHDAWKSLTEEVRKPVKESLLIALQSQENVARHTAAQAASEIATVELPFNVWPEFLPSLMNNITQDDKSEGAKVASLECLGFSCERIAEIMQMGLLPEISDSQTDLMLTAIIDGMQKSRTENIRLAAATALKNSVVFSAKNMAKKEERDAIMGNVCEATLSPDGRVRRQAFSCIVNIAANYYEHLKEYMGTVFELTTQAIKKDEEEVATEAMEFWNTVAEAEMELIDDENFNAEHGIPQPEHKCQRYILAAVEHIVPLLLQAMTKQEEGDDDADQFTIAIAAGTCLSVVASTVEDAITPYVLPFVQQHIKNEDWHFREAATMAFASILEGASSESISAVVNQSIPILMNALNDPNDMVKNTTIFTISRICEMHSRSIPGDVFPSLVNGLMSMLGAPNPKVATQASNAIYKLGSAFEGDETAERTGTNALSSFLPQLLQHLMTAAYRQDAIDNLRTAAFEAVNVLVQYSAPDCKPILLQLLPATLDRLQSCTEAQVHGADAQTKEGLQSLLCGCLQAIVRKLEKEDILPLADNMMTNLLKVLQSSNTTSHSNAFCAVGALADTMGMDFVKYMQAFQPFLLSGLRQYQAYEVCNVAVGLVGDISRALETKMAPFTTEIMEALVESLKDATVHRSVKPPVLSCFGEIALAINAAYEPYIQVSLMLLMQAAGTDAPSDDEDMIEYINELRFNILEACCGIAAGLQDGKRLDLFLPYLETILNFLHKVSVDRNRNDEVLNQAVGLIGDIANLYGKTVKAHLHNQFISNLLQDAMRSPNPETSKTANWALAVVQQSLSA